MRELHATQEEFRRVASRMNGGDPLAAWAARPRTITRPPASWCPSRSSSSTSSPTFIQRQRHHHACPQGEPVVGRADAALLSLDVRQHVDAGAVRDRKPVRAFYYITDVDPSWPAERQDEHLRDFNYGALWAISIHEVFPGHFLHYQHLRQVDVEAAQVDPVLVGGVRRRLGALLRADDGRRGLPQERPGVRLGQLAEALIRLCRFIVGIRLHCEDMSVEQGVRFFREEAFLEEASARREAERGTFDPVLHRLLGRQADAAEAAGRLQGAGRRQVLAARRSTTRCSATAPCRSGCTARCMLGENSGDMIE